MVDRSTGTDEVRAALEAIVQYTDEVDPGPNQHLRDLLENGKKALAATEKKQQ
jgi:hypothetical protein